MFEGCLSDPIVSSLKRLRCRLCLIQANVAVALGGGGGGGAENEEINLAKRDGRTDVRVCARASSSSPPSFFLGAAASIA